VGQRQTTVDGGLTNTLGDWYAGKRVFITGHTGFKGAWLARWLADAGASVTAYALAPEEGRPNLFELARLDTSINSIIGDICDRSALDSALASAQPEMVFHLAAQSLVRRSYENPVLTYKTNVVGTAEVLDAARAVKSLKAIVVVTSDKCYENHGGDHLYNESEPMGGHDPYSSSKGCAELVTSAFRRSYFREGFPAVASARAGNVIGPGDWAEDRLVPDLVRAAMSGTPAIVRNPDAIRPWQFVLEPLRGYLMLGKKLAEQGQEFASAWNFGPCADDAISVGALAGRVRDLWPGLSIQDENALGAPHEATILKLDSAKAKRMLDWTPTMSISDAVEITIDGYREFSKRKNEVGRAMSAILDSYRNRAQVAGSQ
jgi:CDP-glucose 4,6-dehydratase